jgi:methyl-accepting chemotaxis protein
MSNTFKLRYLILLGYAVPILLSIAVAGLVYFDTRTVRSFWAQALISQRAVQGAGNMALGVDKMARSVLGYVVNAISHSMAAPEEFLASYAQGVRLFREASAPLEQVAHREEQRERLTAIVALGNQYDEFARGLIALQEKGQLTEVIKLLTVKHKGIVDAIEVLHGRLNEFAAKESEHLAAEQRKVDGAMSFLVQMVVLGTSISVLFSIGAAFVISSRHGRTIGGAVGAISTTSTEIGSTVEQHERMLAQQASAVNETTTTMEELDVSSRQSAEQAAAAASGAQESLALAEDGAKRVKQTLAGMSSLKEKVEAIAEQILHLSEQTGQIGSITNLVSDLANQTNMLALNAAVEAARAGDHGRGFAVVAGEIRKLADQSKKSAERINALLADIQKATNATVMATEEGTKTVEEEIRLAQATAEAFDSLAISIGSAFENVQQISLNIRQQATAVGQVAQAMDALNAGTKETAAGITQTKISVQNLDEAALRLKAMV